MGIRIFNKADGKTVEPATSTKPQVVKHTRKWYGLPSKTPVPAMSYEQIVADRAQHEADLEADAARRKAGISPPEPPRTSQSILDRKF